MFSRLLVPLDGSPLAEGVLPYALDLAERLHATVYFVNVVHPDTALLVASGAGATMQVSPDIASEELRAQTQAMDRYLSDLAGQWKAKGLDVQWAVLSGVAAVRIVDFAREHRIDLIAMSTHGRSGLSRFLFGSVAEEVTREAGIPVLLIRPPEKPKGAGKS